MTEPFYDVRLNSSNPSALRPTTSPKQTRPNQHCPTEPKIPQKYHNSTTNNFTDSCAQDPNPSQTQNNQQHTIDLIVLAKQIDELRPIDRVQAKLRFQSEVNVCRKRRSNLFRAYEKKIEKQEKYESEEKSLIFDRTLNRKRPLNKNTIKIQKILNHFISKGFEDSKSSVVLDFIAKKHKINLDGLTKVNQSQVGYVSFSSIQKESDLRKIRKYQVNTQRNPPLGHIFNEEDIKKKQQDEEEEEQEQIDDKKTEEDVYGEYYDQIPFEEGYVMPQDILKSPFVDHKRQIFKMARTLIRFRADKQAILKRMAYVAVKEVQRRYMRSLKNQAQFINRAKKLQRQCVIYWRKRQKELIELKKKKEKLEAQLKKRDEQQQESLRQQKRLQYIMYQSGLYSHFMATKLGMEGQLKKEMSKIEEVQGKKVAIDQEAAQLAVNQIINHKADNLDKFNKPGLDLSSVDQVSSTELLGPAPSFIGTLKEYQIKGLRWLNNLFEQGINGILADEMGLGKTIQAIALLSHISYNKGVWGPFLIVAPNSTLFNWEQEFKKFCPTLRVLPYWGSIKQRKTIRKFFSQKKFTEKADSPFHVVITSYQLTVTDDKAFKRLKWQFMILDEAQAIKNILSQRWNTLKQFQARNRLLLTGTPIQNNMAQLWALLNFIMPQLFDSHELFNEWFSKDIEAHSQDQKVLDQIKIQRLHAILKPFMLRRVKKDVQHEIGKKIEHQILCEMTKRQKKLYDSIKDKLNLKQFFKMLQNKIKVENLMNLVMQLRKVCNHPELFERRPPKSPCLFQEMYYYTGSIPVRPGEEKLISFTCYNPITYNYPKLIYDTIKKYQEPLQKRNKRLLNIYEPSNQINNPTFSITSLLPLSVNQIQFCFREDQLFTHLLLAHWIKTKYNRTLSIKENINFVNPQTDQRFILEHQFIKSLVNSYIVAVTAPSIIPKISSNSFYNEYDLLANNTLQKYVMEGKYKQQWGERLGWEHKGLIPHPEQLTKLQTVDFGSLVADSAKLRELDRILKEKKKSNGRVLIFCQMTRMIDILEDFMNMRKYTFFRLDGASNLPDRRDMVNQFQVNPKIFVFLLSTRAGGLGVTLTAANTVIFYDNDWNPTMDAQATDRAHRIGQRSDVFVYQLVTKGTIEERIVKRAEQKKTVQSTVYEGASFNFFKKDMIIELMCDEFGNQEDPKKKEGVQKKKGPKPQIKGKDEEEKPKEVLKNE